MRCRVWLAGGRCRGGSRARIRDGRIARRRCDETANTPAPAAVGTTGVAAATSSEVPSRAVEAGPPDSLTIQIRPTATVWVAATADGASAVYKLLQPGQNVTVTGRDTYFRGRQRGGLRVFDQRHRGQARWRRRRSTRVPHHHRELPLLRSIARSPLICDSHPTEREVTVGAPRGAKRAKRAKPRTAAKFLGKKPRRKIARALRVFAAFARARSANRHSPFSAVAVVIQFPAQTLLATKGLVRTSDTQTPLSLE